MNAASHTRTLIYVTQKVIFKPCCLSIPKKPKSISNCSLKIQMRWVIPISVPRLIFVLSIFFSDIDDLQKCWIKFYMYFVFCFKYLELELKHMKDYWCKVTDAPIIIFTRKLCLLFFTLPKLPKTFDSLVISITNGFCESV